MNYSTEEIGKRIKYERNKRGWKQEELGEKLGEKYKDKKTGKQISVYESGMIPPLPVLLNLCKVFDCELGYLLCEDDYSNKTKLYTSIEKEIGLNYDSIESIKRVSLGVFKRKYKNKKAIEILNNFLSSNSFAQMIESLLFLDSIYYKMEAGFSKLKEKYSNKDFDEARKIYNSDIDYEHDDNIKLNKTLINALKDIDIEINKKHSYQYDFKVAKYEVIEAFQKIINELY